MTLSGIDQTILLKRKIRESEGIEKKRGDVMSELCWLRGFCEKALCSFKAGKHSVQMMREL